ncbi:MAG: IS256 family transposase [Planctomycetota bacterium]
MTQQDNDNVLQAAVELLNQNGFEAYAQVLQILLDQAMKIERTDALGAEPYERSEARRGYANGYKPKTLGTRIGRITVNVPQVRGDLEFFPSALEKGCRSERALKVAIAEMYVKGISTRKVNDVLEKLCGLGISSTQVSRVAGLLDEGVSQWNSRPLAEVPYLVLDARYEKVRHGGSVVSCAVLVAVGLDTDGRRTILGTSVSLSEAEPHWREFLKSLQDRGLHGVRYVVSDDHDGLKAALDARMPGVPWQRCQCHLQRNAMAYVPKVSMRKDVASDIRDIFNSPDRQEAESRLRRYVEKYGQSAPKLAEWMEQNIPEGFTVFILPKSHRRFMRTTNMLERLNEEIKRRTRVVGLFPNETSLLRLAGALLMETDEDWQTGKRYLDMTVENDTHALQQKGIYRKNVA